MNTAPKTAEQQRLDKNTAARNRRAAKKNAATVAASTPEDVVAGELAANVATLAQVTDIPADTGDVDTSEGTVDNVVQDDNVVQAPQDNPFAVVAFDETESAPAAHTPKRLGLDGWRRVREGFIVVIRLHAVNMIAADPVNDGNGWGYVAQRSDDELIETIGRAYTLDGAMKKIGHRRIPGGGGRVSDIDLTDADAQDLRVGVSHAPTTVAALKRALPVGTRVHITNHAHPQHTRDATVVHARMRSFALTHPAVPAGKAGSWVDWPAPTQLVANDDGTVTIMDGDQPFLTLRWLPPIHVRVGT